MTRWDVFVWILTPAAVLVAAAATVVSIRRRRPVGAVIGGVATALAGGVMVMAWQASPEAFEDLALAAAFVTIVLPATAVAVVAALRPRRAPRQ